MIAYFGDIHLSGPFVLAYVGLTSSLIGGVLRPWIDRRNFLSERKRAEIAAVAVSQIDATTAYLAHLQERVTHLEGQIATLEAENIECFKRSALLDAHMIVAQGEIAALTAQITAAGISLPGPRVGPATVTRTVVAEPTPPEPVRVVVTEKSGEEP